MAKARQKNNIEYHPEFLYFNDFVRRNNFYPAKNEWVWKDLDQKNLSPYGVLKETVDACSMVLSRTVAWRRGGMGGICPPPHFCEKMVLEIRSKTRRK